MLMLAQTTGQHVTLNEPHGTLCGDFDEVVLEGYRKQCVSGTSGML